MIEEILNEYFNIGNSDYYILTRDKSAFQYGTMTFDDFKEFDEDIISDLAEFIKNKQKKEPKEMLFYGRSGKSIKYIEQIVKFIEDNNLSEATINIKILKDEPDYKAMWEELKKREKESCYVPSESFINPSLDGLITSIERQFGTNKEV